MTIHEERNSGFITLREASERFGYAPDYIGQLIRKGKVEGKQVHANVAWMTTVEAMEAYVLREGRSTKVPAPAEKISRTRTEALDAFLDETLETRFASVLEWLLRVLLALLIVCGFVVFYILSVSFDHWLSDYHMKHAAERVAQVERDLEIRIARENAAPAANSSFAQNSYDK